MTNEVEILQKELSTILDWRGASSCNVKYAILHTDGAITHRAAVCWATLYSTIGDESCVQTTGYSIDKGMAGYLASVADVSKVIFSILPSNGSLGRNPDYLKAVKRWLSIYECGLVPQDFDERVESGVILDIESGNLNADQIGAFLVGFRNLGEQNRFILFNALVDSGLTPNQAAFWNQMFYHGQDQKSCYRSRGHHTICSEHAENLRYGAILGSANLFTPAPAGSVHHEFEGAIGWRLSRHFFHPGELLLPMFDKSRIENRNEWSGEITVTYVMRGVVETILEIQANVS